MARGADILPCVHPVPSSACYYCCLTDPWFLRIDASTPVRCVLSSFLYLLPFSISCLPLSLAFLFLLPTLPHLDASTGSGGGSSSGGGGGDGVVRNGTRALTDMLTCFGSELNRRRKGEYDHII